MQAKEIKSEVYYYIQLFLKKRWIIIIPSCFSLVIGMYIAFTSERVFEAITLILVEPQNVPENYVKSIISKDINSRINTIKQEILSRSNLEMIIKQFGIFSKPEHENMFVEDKLEIMRERVKVKLTRRGGTDAFEILFTGKNPEKVMNVANQLALSFIDENIRIRESQASSTNQFLNDQSRIMKGRLQVVEANLADYRSRHMGELPEQLDANLSILETLQNQLSEKRDQMRDAKLQLLLLENEFKENMKLLADSNTTVESPDEETMTREQLIARLAYLKDKYTERHPDVIRLKSTIARLESEYKQNVFASFRAPEQTLIEDQSLNPNPEETLGGKLQKIEINKLKREIDEINQQVKVYRQRIERTPKIEEELISLNRDYRNIQDSYNSLLKRRLEAEIAVNMEKKRKGEQFRIIDYAKLPQKPISPRLKVIFMLSLAAGLGIGFGLVLLLDFLDDAVKKPESVPDRLGIPVLVAIPALDHRKDVILRRINNVSSILGVIFFLILIACSAAVTILDMPHTVELIKKYIAI